MWASLINEKNVTKLQKSTTLEAADVPKSHVLSSFKDCANEKSK